MLSRRQQRAHIREMRRSLSDAQRREASAGLCERVRGMAVFARSRHIAGFLAFDGEIDVSLLLRHAISSGKSVYLPILLGSKSAMAFAPYRLDEALRRNDFGILEPDVDKTQWLPARALDLVLTPLVAFDDNGNRLGVGGGFYDRTFAFLNTGPATAQTRLLGVAYEFQRLSGIEKQPWDVPLHGVVTDKRLYPGADGFILQ